MLDRFFFYPLALLAELLRKLLTHRRSFFILINLRWLQRALNRIGIIRAYWVYNHARKKCPAYADFLLQHNVARLKFGDSLSHLPETNKENYIKKYTVEQRCYGGAIPSKGVVIDESSGSSGVPNNWVRSSSDRAEIKKLLQYTFAFTYPGRSIFLINCFALGPWATGMNVSMSLVDVSIMKSVGPDVSKLENTLKQFGQNYTYLICGYPPFIKLFLDSTTLDLSRFELHLVTGGEGMSDGLRAFFLKTFKSAHSSYGASDLDINIGVETEFTIELHALCTSHPELSRALFGQERVPMIFQYNPLDYYVEQSQARELIFTINRRTSAAPKVRYNLKDLGGVLSCDEVLKILEQEKAPVQKLSRHSWLPILFVYGRGDLAVPFYGAKVFSSDVDSIFYDQSLSAHFNSFKISTFEDEGLEHYLKIILEKKSLASAEAAPTAEGLREVFFKELKRVNQDFREVSKMFDSGKLIIEIVDFNTGPFKGADLRVKQNYILKRD